MPSAFGTQLIPDTWQYYDMGNYFGAGASGLSFRRNSYRAYFAPGKRAGERGPLPPHQPAHPRAGISPTKCSPALTRSGDRGFIYAVPYGDHAFLRGTIPAGRSSFSIRGSMPDPALTCAQFFRDYLAEHGMRGAHRRRPCVGLSLEESGRTGSATNSISTVRNRSHARPRHQLPQHQPSRRVPAEGDRPESRRAQGRSMAGSRPTSNSSPRSGIDTLACTSPTDRGSPA